MRVAAADREAWLATAFVELADTLGDDFDAAEFLSVLARRCGELLGAADVGVVVADTAGTLHVVGSSSERLHSLELFAVETDEGPCVESFRTGEAIHNAAVDETRWPVFGPRAAAAGYRVAHSLPMRLRATVVGAVNVFQSNGDNASAADLALGGALADVATIGLLQERALSRASTLAEQLDTALQSRIVIEQAKGILAERHGVDMNAAFSRLRAHARSANLRLADVAAAVVAGEVQIG